MLHTLGNLTLTAYNPSLSNSDFTAKQQILKQSHIELNQHFVELSQWNEAAILQRAQVLSQRALKIWPDFAPTRIAPAPSDVTGTIPRRLTLLHQSQSVTSWRDVLEGTLKILAEGDDALLPALALQFPRAISRTGDAFRSSRDIGGFHVETNLSARDIHRLCLQAVEIAGFTPDDLAVDYS